MSVIVVGQLSTTDGAAWHSTAELTPSGRGAVEHRHLYSSPAGQYRAIQPAYIGVDLNHTGPPVGEVRYLALKGHGLFAVLEVDDDTVDRLPFPMFLSSELEGRYAHGCYTDITLDSVGIVPASAIVAKQPALIVAGDLATAHLYHANPHRQLLREAATYCAERRYKARTEHRVAGAHHIEHTATSTYIDNEPIPVRHRTGTFVPVGGGAFAELEYSVHRAP